MSDPYMWAENDAFNTQWVECVYPISGQYGKSPRYLYYVLVVVSVVSSVFVSKINWIATIAVGSVMTYSGVAAVHAVALFGIRQQLRPWWTPEDPPSFVTVDDDRSPVRVIPQVWDLDSDAVLAIVGIGSLVLLPMQAYSKTFQKSEAKRILLLWSMLLLVGMLSAILNSLYMKDNYGPQFRFCAGSYTGDKLPTTKSGFRFDDSSISRNESWNSTVWNAFNLSYNDICVYPCLNTTWALRNSAEITVLYAATRATIGNRTRASAFFMSISFALIVLVGASALFCLTIFLVKSLGWDGNLQEFQALIKSKLINFIISLWPTGHMKMFLRFLFPDRRPLPNRRPSFKRWTIDNIAKGIWTFCLIVIDLCAVCLSPIAFVVFAFDLEWSIWDAPVGENFQDVGQWGPLVSTVLIFVAAVTVEYGSFISTFIAHIVATFSSSVSTSIAHVVATISRTGSTIIGAVVAKFKGGGSTFWEKPHPVSSEQVGV